MKRFLWFAVPSVLILVPAVLFAVWWQQKGEVITEHELWFSGTVPTTENFQVRQMGYYPNSNALGILMEFGAGGEYLRGARWFVLAVPDAPFSTAYWLGDSLKWPDKLNLSEPSDLLWRLLLRDVSVTIQLPANPPEKGASVWLMHELESEVFTRRPKVLYLGIALPGRRLEQVPIYRIPLRYQSKL